MVVDVVCGGGKESYAWGWCRWFKFLLRLLTGSGAGLVAVWLRWLRWWLCPLSVPLFKAASSLHAQPAHIIFVLSGRDCRYWW